MSDITATCKRKLLMAKADLMNRAKQATDHFNQIDKASGDEIDQSAAHQEEHTFLVNQQRIKEQIMEIDMALARIQNGTYGICEETEEKIEAERLLAIPWTRLSIEGAEIRENSRKKYATQNLAR
jgi:DnaK suppressor protein